MSRSKILLCLLGCVLLLSLLIGLFIPAGFQPFFKDDFTAAAVALLIACLGVFWSLDKFIHRRSFSASGLEWPIFLMLLGAGFSMLFTADFASSFKSLLEWVSAIILFFMLLDLLDTPKRVRGMIFFLIGVAFVSSVYGLMTYYQFATHASSPQDAQLQTTDNSLYYLILYPRAVSFFGWPNSLAGLLLLFLPLVLILPFYFQKIWQKLLSVLVLAVFTACFFCTFSLLCTASLLISAVVLLPLLQKRFKLPLWPFLLVTVTLFIFVILHKNLAMSLSPRLFYYKAAFHLLSTHPFVGIGLNTFGLMSTALTADISVLSYYVHNSYLQLWVETGIIGFAGIALLAFMVIKKAISAIRAYEPSRGRDGLLTMAVSWGMIAFLTDNLFNFTFFQANTAVFFWAMLAVFCALLKMRVAINDKRITIIRVSSFFLIVFIFMMLARISAGYTLYFQAKRSINDTDPIKILGSNAHAITILKKACLLDPWSAYLPAAIGESHMNLFGLVRFKGMLGEAKADYLQAVRLSPRYYENYFVLSKIYEALQEKGNAEVYLQKGRELSPGQFALGDRMFHLSDPKHDKEK